MNEKQEKAQHVRVAIASTIGTTIEWYDFFIYNTAAALVFGKLFFPEFDPLMGILASFATYTIGFAARPIGGIIFGHFGDKIGRKTMLYLTLIFMGTASFLIGVVPTYDKIGIWAPIILIVLRIFQGISVAGEWGGAVLMAVEHSSEKRRGYFGSWPQFGAPFGLVIGTVIFAIVGNCVSKSDFMIWGWRIPFLITIILVIFGAYIRSKLAESPKFTKVKEQKEIVKIPLLESIKKFPKEILIAMGVKFAENAMFYIYTVFVVMYANQILKIARENVLTCIMIAAIIESITVPLCGHISDKVGRRPIYLFGAIVTALMSIPLFTNIVFISNWVVWGCVIIGLAVGHASMWGPQASFITEMFSTKIRYSAASFGYNISAVFAGGICPLVCTWLLIKYQPTTFPISIFMIIIALITIVAVCFAKESYKKNIDF